MIAHISLSGDQRASRQRLGSVDQAVAAQHHSQQCQQHGKGRGARNCCEWRRAVDLSSSFWPMKALLLRCSCCCVADCVARRQIERILRSIYDPGL